MTCIITEFELETGTSRQQEMSFSPRHELEPYDAPIFEGPVQGKRIVEWATHCGTYGMGGPGFVGFKFNDDQWLIISVWGAGNWVWGREKGDPVGRPIERDDRVKRPDGSDWPEPWSHLVKGYQQETLSQHIVDQEIEGYEVDATSMALTFANGFQLYVDQDPERRQPYPTAGPRVFDPDEPPLSEALILSPTHVIWI